MMRSTKHAGKLLVVSLLAIAGACGSDDESADTTTAAAVTTVAATSAPAADSTAAETTATTRDTTADTTPDTAGADTSAPEADTTAVDTSAPTSESSAPSAPATGEPIQVGGIFNLTGPAAATGVTEANGAQLAVEQINAAGGVNGRPLELLMGDAESNPDTAVQLTRDYVRDGMQLIVGPTLASLCQAAREVAEPAGVAMYCLSPIPPQSELVFNIEYSPVAILSAIPAKFMAERGYTRVACIHAADVSGQAYLSTLEAVAPGFGLEIVAVESFQPGDTDVSAQLTNIRGADPDVLFSCASGGDHATVLRGMQQLGMDLPVVLGAGGASYQVAELASEFLPESGAFSSGSAVMVGEELPDDFPGRDRAIAFREDYSEAYGELPNHLAAIAFDVMFVIAEALRTEPEGGAAIADALESVCDLQGVLTTYCLGPDNHSGYQLVNPLMLRWTEEGTFALEVILDAEGIPGRQPPAG